MKKNILCISAVLLLVVFFLFKIDEKVKGWFLSGSSPVSYEIGVVEDAVRKGKVAFI